MVAQPQLYLSSSVMVRISVTRPVPMVWLPSLSVNLWPLSRAMGCLRARIIDVSSPGITISYQTRDGENNEFTANTSTRTSTDIQYLHRWNAPSQEAALLDRPCPRCERTWSAWSLYRTVCACRPPPCSERRPEHKEFTWLVKQDRRCWTDV